jgi:hypothetical protein
MEMNLIYKEVHRARWTGMDFDERLGIASLAAVEAERRWNPNRGQLSTLIVHAIRNTFKTEMAKYKTRMKYDGIQASCLEPSQIPAADSSNPERQAIFRDQIAKLPEDSRLLANLALHTPRKVAQGHDGNVLRGLQRQLRQDRGWTTYRFRKACEQVRDLLS